MADNTELNAGSGGDTIRTLDDGTVKWPAGVTAYATTVGTPDVLQVVTPTAGLPVQAQTGASFPVTDNGSTLSVDDGSGSLTVDGTVAATQSGTWNVGTVTAVTGITNTVTVTGSGGTFPVTDSGGSLTVDGTVTTTGGAAHDAAVSGNPGLVAGYASAAAPAAVSADGDVVYLWADRSGRLQVGDGGGTITVDGTVAATQSGTWTVTGTGGTFPVTDSGGSLTVDNAALSVTGGGTEASAIRVTLASDSTGVLSVDDNGATLSVDDGAGSLTVDNGGTFAVQESGAALTSLQLIDNIVLAEDAVAASGDPGVQVLTVRQDSPASSTSADGDYTPLKTDSAGRLWCNVGNTVTVGSHEVTNAGTFAVQAAQSGTWNVTNVSGTVSLPTGAATAANQATANTALSAIQAAVEALDNAVGGNELQVDVVGSLPAGTNAIGKLAANSGVDIGDVDVTSVSGNVTVVQGTASSLKVEPTGNVAHDAADSGNPLKIGAKATSANAAAVADADRTDLVADLTGKLVVSPYSVPEVSVDGTASSTGTSNTEVIAAQGAGVRIYVTTLVLANSSSTNVTVAVKSATTTRMTVPVPANGGAIVPLPKPLRLAANEALNFAASSGVTTAYCSAVGFAAP